MSTLEMTTKHVHHKHHASKNMEINFVQFSEAATQTVATGAAAGTGASTGVDTSAILDSYQDLEERVTNLESGGVEQRAQAGDEIAAAKAQAEAMIRAALQEVADGAQQQAQVAAVAAASAAAQEQAAAANAAAQATVAGTGSNSNTVTTPTVTTINGNTGNSGTGTVSNGGNGNAGGETAGCCSQATDQVARAANVAASQQIADMAAQIAQLQAVVQGLTTNGASTPAAAAAAAAATGGENQASNNPVASTATVTPPPASSANGGDSAVVASSAMAVVASSASISDTVSDTAGTISSTAGSIIENGGNTGTALDAAAQTLIKTLNLSNTLNLDPKVMAQSDQLVTNIGTKHDDLQDQLAKDCSTPTCSIPSST